MYCIISLLLGKEPNKHYSLEYLYILLYRGAASLYEFVMSSQKLNYNYGRKYNRMFFFWKACKWKESRAVEGIVISSGELLFFGDEGKKLSASKRSHYSIYSFYFGSLSSCLHRLLKIFQRRAASFVVSHKNGSNKLHIRDSITVRDGTVAIKKLYSYFTNLIKFKNELRSAWTNILTPVFRY